MMTGSVTPGNEALMWLKLYGANTLEVDLQVVVDTGFTDYLTLPQSWIDALAFPYLRTDDVTLADGSIIQVAVHEGVLLWNGQQSAVEVHCLEGSPVVGMALLYDYLLTLPVRAGNVFTLTPLP